MAKCQICKKMYKDKRRMRRHMRETHNPKNICIYCGKQVIRIKQHYKKCKSYVNDKNYMNFDRNHLIDNNKKQNQDSKRKIKNKKGYLFIYEEFNVVKTKIPNTDFFYFQELELGKGTYGMVFCGKNNKTNKYVAIKKYSERTDFNEINFECCLLKDLEHLNMFPKIYCFSDIKKISVQLLLGPNLKTLFNFCNRKFDIKTISYIGIELINAVEKLHSIGYIHRDIKPKNISWLNFSDYESILKNNLILIDFGLCSPYVTKENNH